MSDGDGHEGDGDDGPEVRSQQLFLILLADEDDARGVATLLRDIVTRGREADAAFLVPPVRATAYFTGGPAIEHWRKTIPSVPANGVNEWPAPGARTVLSARRIAAASSTSSRGAITFFGLQVTPPDQFDHLPPTIFMPCSALAEPRSAAVL